MPYPNIDSSPAARPRPRPYKQSAQPVARESNALRASVLDAALQLGIADNSAVANWMFNNTLNEEEEPPSPAPDLTHSQESPLSSRYPITPSSSQGHSTNPGTQHVHFPQAEPVPFILSSESRTLIPHITNPADAPPRPSTPSKLKKKRSDLRDGYESEGSTLGDAKRKKDKKDKKEKKEKKDKRDKFKDAPFVPPLPRFAESPVPSVTASEPMGFKKFGKGTASPPEAWGYETDVSRKSKKLRSKKSVEDFDKEVKKSKGLFFKLGKKSSKGDLKMETSPSIMPSPVPTRPLPIAERFATTLNKTTGAPMISMGSNAPQVNPSGSRPAGLGIDLDLGLTGEMFSASPPSRTTEVLSQQNSLQPTPMHSPSLMAASMPPPPLQQQPYANTTPPVSYPSSPPPSAQRRSASPTTSQSTGAGRTSVATSVSTSYSNVPAAPVPLMPALSRQVSNSAITRPSTATSVSSGGAVPSPLPSPLLPAGIPQTPSKRRVLPFFGGTPSRSSSSSGDSQARDRERRREKEEKKREKERIKEEKEREKERLREEKDKMKTKHKPMISLPLTRAGQDAPEVFPIPPPSANSMSSMQSSIQSSVISTPQRTVRPTSPIMQNSHPPISGSQSPTQPYTLSRRASQTQTHTLGLSRQLSLTTTLRSDAAFPIGHVTPIPMERSPSPISPMFPRSKRPRSPRDGRLSPLLAPPHVFVHHDIPPPSPPPVAPLPSVPSGDGISSSLRPGHHVGNRNSGSSLGGVSVNVGIAVTTGSPLPSPLLMTSPHHTHGDSSFVNGMGSGPVGGGKPPPPTSFNHAATAAGSTLRAKVQRKLSLTGGLFTPSSTAASAGDGEPSANNVGANIPIINEPSLSRSSSVRGRESPFPVAPLVRDRTHTPSPRNSHLGPSVNHRGASPQSGWEDFSTSSSNSSLLAAQRHHVNRSASSGGSSGLPQEEADDDFMDGVRDVISRFRESRIDDGSKKRLEDNVIARRGSFEAFANTSSRGNEVVQPTVSSGLTVPHGDGRMRSERYDSFAIEEYYGRPDDFPREMNGYGHGDEGDYYEEDASYYPDDEIPRHSRKRRSTLYASDDDSSGHGHGGSGTNGNGGKSRNSRWSGSIYSRASFMDTERSGEARQRFLRHVEEMLNERGERVPAVPPVPKLPEEFVAESRRVVVGKGKRENGDDDEEFVLKKTVGTGARKVIPAGSGR